jgi:alkylation response protein AidB-like acyl-CoA dehydrogenase
LLVHPLTMAIAAAAVLARGTGAAAQILDGLVAGNLHVTIGAAQSRADGHIYAPALADGNCASWFLLGLQTGDGLETRLVGADTPGVVRRNFTSVDGSGVADVTIDRVAWIESPLALTPGAHEAIEAGTQLLWLGDAAYLCGLTEAALDLALDYMRLRKQFGVPIGSFQALQHRAADCQVAAASARALVHEAARGFGSSRGPWAAAAAVHRASATALHVVKEVVQFHGAIGFADEHDAGLYLHRAMTIGARHTSDALSQLQHSESGRVMSVCASSA